MRPIWIWRSYPTATHEINSMNVTPIAHSIGLRWQGERSQGGWLWQFPRAVEVENVREGTSQRLPIFDITRIGVWLFYALSLLLVIFSVALWWQGRRRVRA